MKLSVSLSTYNEIAELLEKKGISTAEQRELTLEKGTQLEAPVSYKLVTIRRDAAGIAAQVYQRTVNIENDEDIHFIDFANRVYEYIMYGKPDEPKKEEEWK